MNYIDLHCDTLMMAFYGKKDDLYQLDRTMVDVCRLKEGKCLAQFFAMFMLPPRMLERLGDAYPGDLGYIDFCRKTLLSTIEKHPEDMALALSAADLERNAAQGKVSAFLTFEDGRAVEGSMEKLERFYDMGVRLISLTWNQSNCFGHPNSADPAAMALGLTDFGKDAVARMNELGMLVDVSHLSDGGFWDVVNVTKKPFVASHSNCRAIAPHQRNLTDEMIRALADKGGVAGLNFCPQFLNRDVECKVERVEDIVRNARYMADKGGVDCVALGTDFDGIHGELEVGSPTQMHLLFDALKKAGFTECEVEKIAWRNALRVIRDTL